MELEVDSITFGKYKNGTLKDVLKDRKYCEWLVKQKWFQENYEFLYNRVTSYDPKPYFIKPYTGDFEDFLDTYKYFNMTPLEDVVIDLTEVEKQCYEYYLYMIDNLKNKIIDRMEEFEENLYDIKAPVKWLQKFEKKYNISREEFKIFLSSYELPNIPYIVEDIKMEGGIEYKGAQSFIIAKNRSVSQEVWWENILKKFYGENLGTQFKYENCIFDAVCIRTNTIFECKLGLKDFNEEQYRKYLLALKKYKIIYLIDRDCVINIEDKIIYTINHDRYFLYQCQIPIMKNKTKFDDLIYEFKIVEIKTIEDLFKRIKELEK